MNLIDELKMSFRNFLIPFYKSEIKEAYGALYEIKSNLQKSINASCVWPEISSNIERLLILDPKVFIENINKIKVSPREWIYWWCLNKAEKELEITEPIELTKMDGLETAISYLTNEITKMK